jgi:MtfA peptidase
MQIAKGKSDIDNYAFTNKAEFFAVVSEYFFERPELLEEKHPELYKMLAEMFEIDYTNESELH